MNRTLSSLVLAGGLLAGGQAVAGDLLHWQNNSLTYLYGQDYKIDPEIQQTVTFEHASGWAIGDLFFFVDTIKDVLLATTYEFGEDDVESYLIGPGFDLAIPGFDYFSLNFYNRTTDGKRDGDNVWQITPVWSYTIPVGKSDIVIDGFMDWVVDNDKSYHANLHFNPQIKYDLGKAMNWGEKQLYVGIEYDYWKDKYGIEDSGFVSDNFVGATDQNTASLLVKAHF